jgi:hypothetical protein
MQLCSWHVSRDKPDPHDITNITACMIRKLRLCLASALASIILCLAITDNLLYQFLRSETSAVLLFQFELKSLWKSLSKELHCRQQHFVSVHGITFYLHWGSPVSSVAAARRAHTFTGEWLTLARFCGFCFCHLHYITDPLFVHTVYFCVPHEYGDKQPLSLSTALADLSL